ncbi:hypothetical protein V5O48_004012 [Marasmius crinis-equi]|uniref:NmrA-like domain-containing protein n=1 Tax=Marasmius crinis-equi TaxID=585013 RepID=A0ABR3FR87_9AGAR
MSTAATYKSFAIIGATGDVGSHILQAFVSIGVNPLVISRHNSTSDPTLPPSVRLAKVDLEDVDGVADVLKEHNIEVLVSAIATAALKTQYSLAEAAKKAGIKLYVPSEYGFVTDGISRYPGEDESSEVVWKDNFAQHLEKIGLPYARFFVGSFFGYIPWFTGHEENGKVNIVGKGETPVSFTHEEDIGGYVAHVLTTLPPEELANRRFRIEGDNITFVELAKRLKREVAYVDRVPGGGASNEFKNYLVGLFDSGRASVSWDYDLNARRQGEAANDKKLWPGHQWKTFADVGL